MIHDVILKVNNFIVAVFFKIICLKSHFIAIYEGSGCRLFRPLYLSIVSDLSSVLVDNSNPLVLQMAGGGGCARYAATFIT
jgi:hypothetical protein